VTDLESQRTRNYYNIRVRELEAEVLALKLVACNGCLETVSINKQLAAERDAALGENSTLRHAAATTASQSHSAVYSLRNRDVLKLLRALAAVHLAIALNKSLDLLTGFNYDEHRVKQCK